MKMKICFSTMGDKGFDEKIGVHFGRDPTFTIIDTETNDVEIINNKLYCVRSKGRLHQILEENDVSAVVCSNLEHKAVSILEELDICVYIGAYGRVKDALRMLKSEMLHLATNGNACKELFLQTKGPKFNPPTE